MQSFARRLLEVFTGSALTPLISLGYRTGLYGCRPWPATSPELHLCVPLLTAQRVIDLGARTR